MFSIIPLIQPNINFDTLLRAGKAALGRSLSRGLDDAVGSPASFICILEELDRGHSDSRGSVERAGSLARHLQFSFILACHEKVLLVLIRDSGLYLSGAQPDGSQMFFTVVSGNLEQWRTAIINLSTGREPKEVRSIMNGFMNFFHELKLSPLWASFNKDRMDDSTIRLLPRK